ncbi:NUDIX domain-containing protein [Dyella sp. RRB7]|uniref:NUDIX hydrolase n=1 Tax=Dyella sp. RRB7 TaxID=2919502 RepID=UPI001FAAD5CF|nr:NUDIX domain-containing protein [Dyella sp. RRB7]
MPSKGLPPSSGEQKAERTRKRHTLSVSVFVIVRDAQQILLLRRAQTGWKDGYLSLPAGAHDGEETLEQAAVRELREETGLHAQSEDLRLVHLLHCKTGDSGNEWLGAFFLAEHWHGVPVLSEPDKHDQLGWHPLDDLPEELLAYTRQGLEQGLQGIPFSTFGWSDTHR